MVGVCCTSELRSCTDVAVSLFSGLCTPMPSKVRRLLEDPQEEVKADRLAPDETTMSESSDLPEVEPPKVVGVG